MSEEREKRVAAVSLSKIILLSSRQNYLKKVDCIQHHNVEK
jgi:hypothetical protein